MKTRSSSMSGTSLRALPSAIAILCLACGTAGATLQLGWFTVDGGGATACVGGTLALGGTAGQPDAGTLSQGAYILRGGFWKGGGFVAAIDEEVSADLRPVRILSGCPNPFTSSTRIILESPDARVVRVRVYDPSGRAVRHFGEMVVPPGRHEISWDGRGDDGRRLPSGVYLLCVSAGDAMARRSLVLVE
jgi:hypothetical protein